MTYRCVGKQTRLTPESQGSGAYLQVDSCSRHGGLCKDLIFLRCISKVDSWSDCLPQQQHCARNLFLLFRDHSNVFSEARVRVQSVGVREVRDVLLHGISLTHTNFYRKG